MAGSNSTRGRVDSAAPADGRSGTVAVVWCDPCTRIRPRDLVRQLDPNGPWALLGAGRANESTLPRCDSFRAARVWLERGHGLLCLVEDGDEATAEHMPLRLAVETGAALVPVYIPAGADSEMRIGARLTKTALDRIVGEPLRIQVLRWRGQALRYRRSTSTTTPRTPELYQTANHDSRKALAEEVAGLAADCELYESGEYRVYAARAQQIPRMLLEIGRQREITFRAAGEGTGRALDLDMFDTDYFHLFVYDSKNCELVGAYRLGLAEEIIARRGVQGLYTNSLFHFAPDLFDHLGPSIELGRSFIRPQYQRNSRALIWLWKGIARFVSARPAYKTVLGPVSVSADYGSFSREVMVRVLSGSKYRHPLHESVRARNPVLARSFGTGGLGDPRAVLSTTSELHAVVSDAEADRKGLPILLREYLKLGGKVLDFNLDQQFSNVIDALVVVDLLQTSRRLLSFYMGERVADFFDYHRASA